MRKNKKNERGFSVLELLVVVSIALILSAIALPSLGAMLTSYRALGDAQRLSSEVTLARMRAAMDFTQARVWVNLSNNSYRVDVWSKAGNAGNPTGCWQTESSTVACDAPTSAAVTVAADQNFSNKDTVGFGAAGAAPPATQTVFGQAPNCLDNTGNPIANTACVVFNSRGIPIAPGNPLVGAANAATSNDAIYFTNAAGITYAVTVLASGKTSKWSYSNGAWLQR